MWVVGVLHSCSFEVVHLFYCVSVQKRVGYRRSLVSHLFILKDGSQGADCIVLARGLILAVSVGHVPVRKQKKKFLRRAQLRVEGLTTRLERATSRTARRQECCEQPDEENDVPSVSGTADSADPSVSMVHVSSG